MEYLLQFECEGCRKSFVVKDMDVDGPELNCPFCCEEVEVPEDDDDEDQDEEI